MYGLETMKKLEAEARRREEQEADEDMKLAAYTTGRKIA